MKMQEEVIRLFPSRIREILKGLSPDFEKLQEIRLRSGQPLLLRYDGRELLPEGENAYPVSSQEIRETMEAVARHSLYAHEEELRQGFLTIPGGHRVGIAGRTVLEGDKVRSMKYISFINVRLSHQRKGCGNQALPFLYGENGQVCHTLLISPPGCGKTTLLRDLIRQISDGGRTVGVVDERSEIGGCYLGVPGNDLGMRTDVLDCCPKGEGMMMLIRSMAPEVIAVDEIGSEDEIRAIEAVLHCGCRLLATVHGSSMEDIRRKPLLQRLVREQVFDRYIILGIPGSSGWIRQILDRDGNPLHTGKEEASC